MPGNHHYCFVDFETREEAIVAMNALRGRAFLGGNLKVSLARRIPEKLMDRHTEVRYGGRRMDDENPSRPGRSVSGSTGEPSRAIGSRDWRRRVDE